MLSLTRNQLKNKTMTFTKKQISESFYNLICRIHEKVEGNLFYLAGATCFFFAGLSEFSNNKSGAFFVVMIACGGICAHLLSVKKKGKIVRSVSPLLFGLTLFFVVLKIAILVTSGPAKQTAEPMPASYFEQSE